MDLLNISGVSEYASMNAKSASTDAIKNKANAAKTDEEMLDACKEFESYLWEQVIKSMKNTVDITGSDSSESKYVDYFMDTAVSDVAKNLTEQNMGPNSLAMQMFEQMKRTNTISPEE